MIFRFDGKQPTIGSQSYVSESARVIGDVAIGDNCYVGHGVILRGDYGKLTIGSGTAVEEGVIVHAPPGLICDIGSMVTIGHGAIVHGKHIDDYAVIGMGATVSIQSEVGRWSIVAEGCVVKMNQAIPPGVVVAGSPAKVMRDVSDMDKAMWNKGKQIYIDLAKKYLEIGMQEVNP